MTTPAPHLRFSLKFGSALHQMDANTLTYALIGITTLLTEINREVRPESKVEVKVQALREGSFVVDLTLLRESGGLLAALFSTPQNLQSLSDLLGHLTELLKLKQSLGGDAPQSVVEVGERVAITAGDGNTITVHQHTYHLAAHSKPAQNELHRAFDAMQSDPDITGFEVENENSDVLFTAPRSDFSRMASPFHNALAPVERVRKQVEAATLNIVRLCFEPGAHWHFVYTGHKITASIKDESFFDQIDDGESFAKGDALEVELEIAQQFDPAANAWLNKSYAVLVVHRHIPRDKQNALF